MRQTRLLLLILIIIIIIIIIDLYISVFLSFLGEKWCPGCCGGAMRKEVWTFPIFLGGE